MMRLGKCALTRRGKQLVNANGEGTLARTCHYGTRAVPSPLRPQPPCPRRRPIQYAAAPSLSRHRLWRPLTRAMTLNVWQERRLKRKRRGFGPASFALNIQLAAYLTLGSRSPCRARLARRRGGRSGRGRASRRRSRGRSRDRRRRRRDRRRARRRCRP